MSYDKSQHLMITEESTYTLKGSSGTTLKKLFGTGLMQIQVKNLLRHTILWVLGMTQ